MIRKTMQYNWPETELYPPQLGLLDNDFAAFTTFIMNLSDWLGKR